MLRLIQLIYGSNPSRGSFDRAEINSRRPLAPFFLNRIRRTESMFFPQLPRGLSFWRSHPRSRHSGAAATEVVILAKPESPYLPLLRRCTFRRADASHTESMFCPQLATNASFAGATRAKASFLPITLMS